MPKKTDFDYKDKERRSKNLTRILGEVNGADSIDEAVDMVDMVRDAGNESQKTVSKNVSVLYPLRHIGEVMVLVDTSAKDSNNKKVRNGLFLFEKIENFNINGIKKIITFGATLYKFSLIILTMLIASL